MLRALAYSSALAEAWKRLLAFNMASLSSGFESLNVDANGSSGLEADCEFRYIIVRLSPRLLDDLDSFIKPANFFCLSNITALSSCDLKSDRLSAIA